METLILLLHGCGRHVMHAKHATGTEVAIAGAICLTVLIGTIVVARLLSKWHNEVLKENQELRALEEKKAENERKSKMKADYQVKILDYIAKHAQDDGFDANNDPYIKKIEQFINEL